MANRKKWRLSYPEGEHDDFGSAKAAYDFVVTLRRSWQSKAPGHATRIRVLFDQGHGWELNELINFEDE